MANPIDNNHDPINHMPTVRLENGLLVANFSSPHEFLFTDGSKLPACSSERARDLMLIADEKVSVTSVVVKGGRTVEVQNIDLEFRLSPKVEEALLKANQGDADIILVPFPVMRALKDERIGIGRCRVIRVADRVTKEIFTDKFCV